MPAGFILEGDKTETRTEEVRLVAHIKAETDTTIAASPNVVYEFLADYSERHPRILTPNFSDYSVEEGGQGAGTVVRYRLRAGRERPYRMRVEEPERGSVITERDMDSSFTTTWELSPANGESTRVRVTVEWDGASGIAGIFERLFAPGGVRGVYSGVLENLKASVEGTS